MKKITLRLLVTSGLFICNVCAAGVGIFTLDLEVSENNQKFKGSIAFDKVEQLFNSLNEEQFKKIADQYTSNSDTITRIGYRGLPVEIEGKGKEVILRIPSLNQVQIFNSKSTRDENYDDLGEFFKRDGGAILSALQKKLAAVSPVDPIAGNPNSLQSLTVSNDFSQSFTSFASNIKAAPSSNGNGQEAGSNSGLTAVGLRFGSYSQGGLKSESTTLPLSYTYRNFGEGKQLTFSMPITVGKVGDAQVLQIGSGVSYRHPINKDWSLTPAVGLSAAGSIDLGSAAAIQTMSLTSHYDISLDDRFILSIGNMVGSYKTLKIQTKDFSYDPDISNIIYRNGVMLSQPVRIADMPLAVEYSFINTIFTGSELYNKWTNEFGVTVGTRKGYDLPSYLRFGITLLQGQHSKGVSANFGYWF